MIKSQFYRMRLNACRIADNLRGHYILHRATEFITVVTFSIPVPPANQH